MNHLFSFRTWRGPGLVRVEGWRGLVAHEGLKGSFFLFLFFCFTRGHLDVRSAPYSRRILKRYSPRKLQMSIVCPLYSYIQPQISSLYLLASYYYYYKHGLNTNL
jgi:hypothetical protein